MTTIYLVRHGRTDWNEQAVFRGRVDRPLDAVGRQQAEAVADALGGLDIRRVFSSPLIRARHTADPLAKQLGLDVELSEGLNDMDFGQWQGLSEATVEEQFSRVFAVWTKDPFAAQIPGGETLAQIWNRVNEALKQISAMTGAERAVVVTHRVVLKILLCGLTEAGSAGFWAFQVDLGSISEIEYHPERATIARLNDTDHMKRIAGLGPPRDF